MSSRRAGTARGVYPGSFDPPTIAHVAIAEAAVRVGVLDHLELAISRVPLGKDAAHQAPVETRVAVVERLAASRPWLHVVVTDAQLVTEIAVGYDVVVMGADKWAQVCDPAWYGGSPARRDAAVASLARVLVAPRPGFAVAGAEVLDVPPHLAAVSSSAARAGRTDLIAPECRTAV